MAASSVIKYGLGNLISWLDGGWTIGEFNGDIESVNSGLGNEGIRIDPGIESNVGMNFPSVTDSVTQPVSIYSTGGGAGEAQRKYKPKLSGVFEGINTAKKSINK